MKNEETLQQMNGSESLTSGIPQIKILIVDDELMVLDALGTLLKEHGYAVTMCERATDAVKEMQDRRSDIVLSDINMPQMTGIELLEMLHAIDSEIPVILMTGYADLNYAIDAIRKGAFDFITKPFRVDHLVHTIEKAANFLRLSRFEKNYKIMLEDTVKKRTQELSDALVMVKSMSREILGRLISVAEFRDSVTGAHISRIGMYANKLAETLDMTEEYIDLISFASPLHDIGKVGIPDTILLKPGGFTPEEREIMKKHTSIGEQILSGSTYSGIKMAAVIAKYHHERWDGTGYPEGLRGEEIPLEARIVMLADQYDALRSIRPYRTALTHEETLTIITEGDGRTHPGHFDPNVLCAFMELSDTFDEIFVRCQTLSAFKIEKTFEL